jgi:hypothetical protein
VNYKDSNFWVRVYTGLAMQEAMRTTGFQGGPEAQERAARMAVAVAKVAVKVLEEELECE